MPVPRLVGRVPEIASLRREFDAVAAGPAGPGRVVVVSGDPGVGKTRLVQEFARQLGGRALVLAGRGSPLAGTVPFGIVVEPLDAHLSALPEAERAALGPALAGVLGGESPDRLSALSKLRGLLTRLAVDRPLLLLLDDLHQADQSTGDLVAYLGRQPPRAAVLVVAVTRVAPLVEAPDLAATVGTLLGDGLATEVRLGALDRTEVADLAAAVLGARPEADLVGWLYDRAGGNALLTTALVERVAAGGPAHGPAPTVPIPDAVRERVIGIRAALPEPVRAALDVAAVLGHSFPAATIAAVTGPDAPARLDRLVSERLLAERPDGYDFTHPLLQEAAYDTLGAARRRQLHAEVGRALVAAPLAVRAYHVARGALPGDLDAVELLRQAAAETARRQAHRETLAHLAAALALTPHGATELRRELLADISGQASAASDHVTGLTALDELVELDAGDPVRLARVKMQQASFLSTGAADVGAAEAAATEAVDLMRAAGATEHLAAALNERAWIRGMGGDFRGQLDGCREALALARDDTDVLHIVGPMGGVLGLLGDFAAAREAHRRARPLAAATNDPAQIGWHAAVAHLTDLFEGRFSAAVATLDPAVDPAPAEADIGTPWRSLADWFVGRWGLGAADCAVVRESFPVAPSAHMAWSLAMAALFSTAGAATLGPPTQPAEALLRQSARAYDDRDVYFFTALADWATGVTRWLGGDPDAAEPHLRKAATWLCRVQAIGFEGLLGAELADVLAATGRRDDLAAAADRAAALARRLATPFAAAQAAYAAGLSAAFARRPQEAASALEAAATGFAKASAPFLQARALEHLVRVEPRRALTDLATVAQLYGRLPAPGHRERVLALLRSTGTAGRRAAQHVGALTERERQIAELAAGGLPTPQIAARLHLSARTVETHLGRVYHKLGVDGRARLAEALGREGA